MLSYCLKCKKNTESINTRVSKTSNGKTMILSKCAMCGIKKSKFIKAKEVKGLLSNLDIRTPLSKIPLLGDVLFRVYEHCLFVLLSKVWRKYKKHYYRGFKSYKWWENNIIKMYCMW